MQLLFRAHCINTYNSAMHIKNTAQETAVASMFQNGISRNTRCAKRDGFRREGHKS